MDNDRHVLIDYEVDIEHMASDEKSALLPVLNALPRWADAPPEMVQVLRLSGGMTNFIFRCSTTLQGEEQVVLVRVNGGEVELFDRKEELEIFKAVSNTGMGPKLLAVFSNGRVEEFLVKHTTFLPNDIQNPLISPAVAAAMADFHLHMSTALGDNAKEGARGDSVLKAEPILWRRLRDWLQMVEEEWTEERPPGVNIQELQKEVNVLKAVLHQLHPLPIGFCHNDLQYGNIMKLKSPPFSSSIPTSSPSTQHVAPHPTPTSDSTQALPSPYTKPLSSPLPATHPPRQDDTSLELDSDGTDGDHSSTTVDVLMLTPEPSPPSTSPLLAAHPAGPSATHPPSPMSSDTCYHLDAGTDQDDTSRPSGAELAMEGEAPVADSATASQDESERPLLPESVTLIDFEFSGFNPVAFDIANHWCEWAADYHTDTPHLLDYSKYPTPAEQREFAAAYLQRLLQNLGDKSDRVNAAQPAAHLQTEAGSGRSVTAEGEAAQMGSCLLLKQSSWLREVVAEVGLEVQQAAGTNLPHWSSSPALRRAVSQLVVAANDFVCLSHLQWALWGYIQAKVSCIDFDFMSYGDQRMVLYHEVKKQLLPPQLS